MHQRNAVLIVLLSLAVVLAGCSGSDPNRLKVTKAELGSEWPFTVDEGYISYDRGGVYFTANGVTYTVNGTSRGIHPDYPHVFLITIDEMSPTGLNLKKDVSPIIDRGLKLGEKQRQQYK